MASHTLHLGGAGPGTAPGGGRCSRCRRSARSRLSSEAGSAPPSTCRRVPFIVWAVNIFASSETRVQHRRPVLLWSASRGADSRFSVQDAERQSRGRPANTDRPAVVLTTAGRCRVPVRLSPTCSRQAKFFRRLDARNRKHRPWKHCRPYGREGPGAMLSGRSGGGGSVPGQNQVQAGIRGSGDLKVAAEPVHVGGAHRRIPPPHPLPAPSQKRLPCLLW